MDDLMPDVITVVKADGRRYEKLKALVERAAVIFDDVRVPLDEGDHIERALPGGRTELYEVLDTGFQRGGGAIPDFYHAKVRKTTSRSPHGGATNVTISGHNARLNIGSVDSSTNVVNGVVSPEVFTELAKALRGAVKAQHEQERMIQQVHVLQRAVGTPDYRRAYREFVEMAANWMTIVAPFIPALTRALAP